MLRHNFVLNLFSLLGKGRLHRRMRYDDMVNYFEGSFGGFPELIRYAKKVRNVYYGSKSKEE